MPRTLNRWQLTTPIAFFIFNRPETTLQVFETIRQAKPPILLVVADGPRRDRIGEAELCAEVKSIVEKIDWDCKVYRNYSDTNLGCKYRVSSGLDWVFKQVEEAIILEDDCLPNPSFFRFCEELLERYRNNPKIMNILGSNFLSGHKTTSDSYYFSRYTNAWGWATWRRAWCAYDVHMKAWPKLEENRFLSDFLGDFAAENYWQKIFHKTYSNEINTWDYQWMLACWQQNALSVFPQVNLVSNIGFSAQATHTTERNSKFDSMPTESMSFPMSHPIILRDEYRDRCLERELFSQTIAKRAIARVKQLIGIAHYKTDVF